MSILPTETGTVDGRAVVYVALVDEGTDVWRPVAADRVGRDSFRLIGTVPDDERWEHQPGDVVRCRERPFVGGVTGLVAVERVQEGPT